MNRESPFLAETTCAVPPEDGRRQGALARLVHESPFASLEQLVMSPDLVEAQAWPDVDARADAERIDGAERIDDAERIDGAERFDDEAIDNGQLVNEVLRDEAREGESITDEWIDNESIDDDESFDVESIDDEARDAHGLESPDALDAHEDEAAWSFEDLAAPLSDTDRAWILALDRSAIERLPDTAARQRHLEGIDWRSVEFPGNVPKGGAESDAMRRRWRVADELFAAMATLTPERRVPSSIAYHDPAVEEVPGQTKHRLFPQARDAFVRMREAADADGVRLVIASSARSRTRQADISRQQPNPKAAARGRSAHMYGLAVDLIMSVPGLRVAERNTRTAEKMANLVRMYRSPVYKWMALRGREFGWYPYRREPWHWEYNPPGFGARFEQAGASRAPARTPAPATADGGGRFSTFVARSLPLTVGVYASKAALGQPRVDVLLFAHGLLDVCGGPASAKGLVLHRPLELAKIADASQHPLVLVVPEMDWSRHRGAHPLGRPAALNGVLAEALEEVGRVQHSAAPSLATLVLAGHSRAYGFIGPLARAHADAQMAQGALAALAQVWALDSTYAYRHTHDATSTLAWLRAKPGLRIKIAYRARSLTAALAKKIAAEPHERLTLIEVPRSQSHCALPVAQLPGLLRSLGRGSVDAEVDDETDDESLARDIEFDAEHEDDDEAVWSRDEQDEHAAHEAGVGLDDFGLDAEALEQEDADGDFDDEARDDQDDEARDDGDDNEAFEMEATAFAPDAAFDLEAMLDHDTPRDPTLRDAIVGTALREWEHWGRGTKKETHPEMRPQLARYWSAVIRRDRKDTFINTFIDKRHAWSAAFVSWVMQQAGAGSAFRSSPHHTGYIEAAKRGRGDAAKFQALRIDDAAVEAGDVVCKDRPLAPRAPCAGTTYDNVHTRDPKGGMRVSHGDIVVDVDRVRHRARVVGGNVGNSVADGWIALTGDDRLPARAGRCAYIAVLKPPGGAARGAPAPRSTPAPRTPAPDTPASGASNAGEPGSPRNGSPPLPRLPNLGAGLEPPSDPAAYRKFRLTTYHVVDQSELPTGAVRIPILDARGARLAEGSPAFFGQLSLEGTGRLRDGRLINVTGKTVPVSHADYADVLAYHRQAYAGADRKRASQGRPPTPTSYSGIVVEDGRVVRALAFHEVARDKRGAGYGSARSIAYTPFRTLAADIGHKGYGKVDPRWKGKGGLVPPGTQVYIKEYDGLRLPDGTTHDGWFIVNDTGGAIFGAHFDVFTGTRALRKQLELPAFGQVWFAGIEQRVPAGYTYGLSK